jgi:hypothetical protein
MARPNDGPGADTGELMDEGVPLSVADVLGRLSTAPDGLPN